jgi:predicted phage terminase large subunit-like protein
MATAAPRRGSPNRLGRPVINISLPPLHPHQRTVLEHPARFKVLAAGRRWGKTALGVLLCVMGALRGETVWWVSPIYQTSEIGWRQLKRFARQFPRTLRVVISESTRTLYIPLTGGYVAVKSAHDPDSLRGEGLGGFVMDEAAYVKREAWTAVLRPMLIDTGGWGVFISTPAGRNWFADLYDRALARPDWMAWQRPTSDNPRVSDQELADAAEDMGIELYAQEHEAQFLDAIGTVFRSEHFRYFHVELEGEPIYHLIDPRRRSRTWRWSDLDVWSTCDPALSLKQSADYTVIGTFAMTPEEDMLVLDVQRFRAEHPDIIDELATVEALWHPTYIGVDRQAHGLAIIQDAIRRGINVEPLENKGDKVARARPVSIRMRGGKVWFDAEASWLRALEVELCAFPKGKHDDQVDVLAYADRHRVLSIGASVRVLERETDLGWSRVT